MILRCQPGYEIFLEKELRPLGFTMSDNGGGWIEASAALTAEAAAGAVRDVCFAHSIMLDPVVVTGESVNALAGALGDLFFESARTERFDGEWPLSFECGGGLDGLGRRVDGVEKAFGELLRKRMSRVAKLAVGPHRIGSKSGAKVRGLFVYFVDFNKAFVARECVRGGQRRMADDALAPSRSYLKVEEAYGVLGAEPVEGELVVDLGAAPGGWSFSAAKRGARVVAVDNGPLKGGALENPLITHLLEDAFRYDPLVATGGRADWLFSDLLDEPHAVLEAIVVPWIERGWCRRFVVNLKFGRVDPVALLDEVRAPSGPLATRCSVLRVRHLYHDREEFTLVGEVR